MSIPAATPLGRAEKIVLLAAASAAVVTLVVTVLLALRLGYAVGLLTGAYLGLVGGTAWAILRHWRRGRDELAREERVRLALDLHAGLAQDLAFIISQSQRLACDSNHPALAEQIVVAARRALAESRQTMNSLRGADATFANHLSHAGDATPHPG